MLKKLISTLLTISILFPLTPSYAKDMDAFAADLSGAEMVSSHRGAKIKATESDITVYGGAYATFPVMLPEGKLLSDYEAITFTFQADGDADAVPLSILAAPRGSFPEEIAFDGETIQALNAVNIASGTDSGGELEIDRENAALLGTRALEFSLYPHWEDTVRETRYTIADVVLIPAEKPLDNVKATVTDISFNLEEDNVRVNLSRALTEGETLTVEAYNERNMRIGKWTRDTTVLGLFVFNEVKTKSTNKIVAYVYDKKMGNRFEQVK